MRAARLFAVRLADTGLLDATARIRAELFGSLGATGKGHGSDKAVLLGLAGHEPDTVDVDAVPQMLAQIRAKATVLVKVAFVEREPRALPDMSAKVAFLKQKPADGDRKPVTAVRKEALIERDGKPVVGEDIEQSGARTHLLQIRLQLVHQIVVGRHDDNRQEGNWFVLLTGER